MSYQMTGPEDDPTSPWDYLKFGLGAMAPDNAGPFLRDNLGLGLSSDAPAPAPAPVQDGMAGWASPPDQGGLGMRGQSDAAPAGSGMNWVDALKGIGGALEGFSAGFHGRTPLFVKMQELDQQQQLRRDALAQQQQARRDTIKQQMAQLEEQRQQHYRDMTMKMVESGNYEGLKMLGEQYKYAPAVNLAQGLAQSDLSRLPGLMEKGYLTQDDVDAAFSSDPAKRLGPNAIRARVKLADQMDMEDEKANAKQAFVRNALNIRDQGKPLTAAQERAIQENETNLQLTDAKRREAEATATLKEVQAENEWLNYGQKQTPDHSVLNRVHMAQNNGRTFEEGDTASQQRALKEYAQIYPQGRTEVQMGTVPPLKDQADYYTVKGLESLELVQAPKGMTEGQYRSGPYRQLDDKEKDAVVQYRVAQKTVETMNKVADQLITAKTPFQAAKQKLALEAGAYTGKNGLAAAYQKDRDAFSSRMARLVEVGVLTNTDVTRWSDTFGSFGDTVQTLKAKQALFGEIQNETSRLLKLKLGGKPIDTNDRSKLDQLLDKTDTYRSVDTDFDILMGKGK